jgi:MFS family permease
MLTMLVIVLHTFCTNVPTSFVNYYLLNNDGVQYTYIYAIHMVYPFMLLFLQPIARRLINRFGWFKVLAVSMLIHAPSWVAYACVTGGNYLWLFTATRIFQHVVGVCLNTAYSNIAYVNLPPKDQTNYFSFYQLAANLTAFTAMMLGTGLVALIGDWTPVILGISLPSVQLLILLRALGNLVVPIVIFSFFRILDPQTRAAAELQRT